MYANQKAIEAPNLLRCPGCSAKKDHVRGMVCALAAAVGAAFFGISP